MPTVLVTVAWLMRMGVGVSLRVWVSAAQDRLRHLRELGVVFAFRESSLRGGTSQTRYALGYLGARLIAAQVTTFLPAD